MRYNGKKMELPTCVGNLDEGECSSLDFIDHVEYYLYVDQEEYLLTLCDEEY